MADAPPMPGQPAVTASSTRMVMAMSAIGLAAATLIVLVYQWTFPIIKKNRAEFLERAIFEVIPGASSKQVFELADGQMLLVEGESEADMLYYAGYDDEGHLAGVAMEAAGPGFQETLTILYAYSPACECIVGMKVLESKETPGLGDKIETDPEFRANFEALEVRLDADGTTIVNPIVMAKEGEKTDAWQVEAITGATISSRAIARILRASTEVNVPVIVANLDVLTGGTQ